MSCEHIAFVKASPITLSVETTSEQAFVTIIAASLKHAEANRAAVLDAQIEGVHQMRVAFRRLRSGLKIFRPLIPREASTELVANIRWLNSFLGPARDWDVFMEEGMVPVFAHFPRKRSLSLFRAKAEILRQNHRQSLRTELGNSRYLLLLQQCTDFLEHRPWRESLVGRQRERLDAPVLVFTTPLLEEDHRRVLKRGERFAQLVAEERHALRIRIKELRYAQDFFASLYPPAPVKSYLDALAKLQDCLGIMNDVAVARRLLDEARLTTASAARQVIEGWYGCRLDAQESLFDGLWQRFMECERPWKK
ncbi:MAG: CHAD domain-containing protein [Phycisphaerales bacterium]|nr:CHAD domain-containing protein [Phycisphaerales bacterium]